jgi:hypothetical protein
MTTIEIPQVEGQFTPEEAQAWLKSQTLEGNLAGVEKHAAQALKVVQSVNQEWTERMRPMHRRWRATFHMLAGNTLEKGGPEDVHVPEIYKAIETIIPRVEEAILEKDPWFRVVPRRRKDARQADTIAAYMDWQFDQAGVRSQIQPAVRDMLVTQFAAWHVHWDNKESWRNVREIDRTFDKDGVMRRTVKVQRKKVIDYSGARAKLVDPFDFIIDTKATDPQSAVYVGHRVWMTTDEVKRYGKQSGWRNLDDIGKNSGASGFSPEQDFFKWSRDPAARYGDANNRIAKNDGRPDKVEVVFLHTKLSLDDGETYEDYRIVCVAGKHIVELRVNPNDGQLRPYATMRVTKSGHEFFGTGPFDNAIRLNQHLDRYHQIFLRAAEVSACPMVFAEEDSDLPDSLYKIRPFSVFKGVGPVRFTQIPDGSLRSAPLVIGMLQKNIEETVGAFRINMGQDSNGTATEASLSLQEGNRRMRGIIRSVGDGLEQVLNLFYRLSLQYSVEDVEFPVLGKRALDLRKTHMNVSPADLLNDVKFDLVGLHSSRTYGLKATGMMSFINSMQAFIVANPNSVDQVGMMYEMAREMIGPDEADAFIKVPTPLEKLRPQSEENEGLITGEEIEIDPDDNDAQHLKDMEDLFQRAMTKESNMHFDVRRVVLQHALQHTMALDAKKARKQVMEQRKPQVTAPEEAGGQPSRDGGKSSPMAGGMSNAMQDLADSPGGQTQGENPGPADMNKTSRTGTKRRPVNQTDN